MSIMAASGGHGGNVGEGELEHHRAPPRSPRSPRVNSYLHPEGDAETGEALVSAAEGAPKAAELEDDTHSGGSAHRLGGGTVAAFCTAFAFLGWAAVCVLDLTGLIWSQEARLHKASLGMCLATWCLAFAALLVTRFVQHVLGHSPAAFVLRALCPTRGSHKVTDISFLDCSDVAGASTPAGPPTGGDAIRRQSHCASGCLAAHATLVGGCVAWLALHAALGSATQVCAGAVALAVLLAFLALALLLSPSARSWQSDREAQVAVAMGKTMRSDSGDAVTSANGESSLPAEPMLPARETKWQSFFFDASFSWEAEAEVAPPTTKSTGVYEPEMKRTWNSESNSAGLIVMKYWHAHAIAVTQPLVPIGRTISDAESSAMSDVGSYQDRSNKYNFVCEEAVLRLCRNALVRRLPWPPVLGAVAGLRRAPTAPAAFPMSRRRNHGTWPQCQLLTRRAKAHSPM
mmetsp:Transcript_12298/g.39372  ORF Transcript_12298/g.39372 Transcript_12298/m.39372 type:complete len:459 (-) Transcript_12298:342-1718(-)